jgi:hypothetical protein
LAFGGKERKKGFLFLEMTNLREFTLHDLGDEEERLAEIPVDFNVKTGYSPTLNFD